MNVEKMIKRDISVEIANYLTNNLPCYEKKNIDDEKTYETNFLHLMNVIGKNVINIPRKVHYSRELIKKMNEEFPKELCDLIKLFEKKFDKGESVKGYLSKKAFDVEFKDILLNQWGIKHLHLTDKEANSIEEMKNNRSNILLFFIVDNQDVYFLDVRKHPKGAGFITLEVLYIVYNNRWMEKIGARKVEGIIDLQPEIDSNEELYKLYKNDINCNMLKFGNEVYRMGWGVSSKGHKMDYSIILCELNRKISQISCKYGDRYAGFELTLDGHFGNVILEGSGNKIPI